MCGICCCCDCAKLIACCCCTCALQTLCCMVLICLAIGLGVYFGVFHNRDSNSDTSTTTPSSILLNALLPEALRDEKEPIWGWKYKDCTPMC